MNDYFISGNIQNSDLIPEIKIGDYICYDKKIIKKNGRFANLGLFKEWLDQNFEYHHIRGEEPLDSICIYKISEIKREFPGFTALTLNSGEVYYNL
ncbi:MAG: hypothetical protein H7Y07_00255 [Pyrinomonadaceae bacterium]|nr:hypothetical protein [Sphingobacteriaceae bacterium]